MAKKFSLLMAAVAVLAFAIPAIASAAPSVTSKAGTLATVGTKITGTSVALVPGNPATEHVLVTNTTFGTLTCKHVTIEGEITENTGTSVKGKGVGAGTSSECNAGGNPLTVDDITVTALASTVAGSGTASFSFTATLGAGKPTCVFTGTNVPFTYAAGTSHLTFTGAEKLVGSPVACGNGTLDATFTVEIGTTHVILD